MHYLPPSPGSYPPNYYPPSSPANGHESMLLGSMLGELKSGQVAIVSALGQQTGVLHRIHDRLEENAKLMAHLPEAAPAATTLEDRLQIVREILKTLVPLALLAAIIMGKITFLEAWPLIRQSLGLAG